MLPGDTAQVGRPKLAPPAGDLAEPETVYSRL